MSVAERPIGTGRTVINLAAVWHGAAVIIAAMGLMNVAAETGAVDWAGPFEPLLSAYHLIVHGFWDRLFGWLPFGLAALVKDYLTLGFVFTMTFFRVRPEPGSFLRDLLRDPFDVLFTIIIGLLITVPAWPLLFVHYVLEVRRGGDDLDIVKPVLMWCVMIVIAVAGLIGLNAAL